MLVCSNTTVMLFFLQRIARGCLMTMLKTAIKENKAERIALVKVKE